MTLEEKWELVDGLLSRVALLETRVYDLERARSSELVQTIRFAPNYIPGPTIVPAVRPSRTDDPISPWPEITCGTYDRPRT